MKTHNILQGSPQWLAYRFEHCNASEAAAMLGISKTTTRTELMHMMHTGLGKEFSDWVQRNVLDYGHEVEAKVRPLVEVLIGDDLYPVTCSEGKLSASLDGLTMCGEIAFECKQWNAEIAAQVAAGDMPEQHMPQCQQILMITGAKKVVFAVGDGTPENLLTLDVLPDPVWFNRIMQGWTQFAIDLAAYVPAESVAKPVGRSPETLPALHIEVTGMVTASNLAEYKAHALSVFGNINRELVTDQDFASAESTVKWCSDIEARVEAAKQHALGQTASIDTLFRALDEISAEARATRLELKRLVDARKDSLRAEIVSDGRNALVDHLDTVIVRVRCLMPSIPVDFANAIKGKRTLTSMRDAVSVELARAKIAANEIAERISSNLSTLDAHPEHAFLFRDIAVIVLKHPEDLQMLVTVRINEHKAKETARLEAEAAAKARADAEIAAATEAAQQEAARASAEAIAKAQAEQTTSAPPLVEPAHEAIKEVAEHTPTDMVRFGGILIPRTQIEATWPTKPAAVCEIVQIDNKAGVVSPLSPPTLRLGQICERLGFTLTADFLKSLGFEHAATDKAAKLYHENDFHRICLVLVRHIQKAAQGVEA